MNSIYIRHFCRFINLLGLLLNDLTGGVLCILCLPHTMEFILKNISHVEIFPVLTDLMIGSALSRRYSLCSATP